MRDPKHSSLVLALLVAACSGQSGSEGPNMNEPSEVAGTGSDAFASEFCEVASSQMLGIDETSPLGFSGRDMLDLAEGVYRTTLSYENGETTGLRSVVNYTDGNVVFIDRRRTEDSAGPSAACPDSLEVTVEARIETDDGRFDEDFGAVLTALQPSENGYFVELNPDAMQGSFDFSEFDDGSYDRRRVFIDALFDSQGSNGRISGVGENDDDPDNPDDTASSRFVPIGNWE